MDNKLHEICGNARENGSIEDPRVTFDTEAETSCGFKYKDTSMERLNFLKVCGNCKDYNVQR